MRTASGAVVEFVNAVAIPYTGDDCLVWPFGSNGKGYGVFHQKRKAIAAHVYICAAVHGPKPTPDHEVAHSCGRGHLLCVNPNHLRWATRKENHADKAQHGTMTIGIRNPAAKLTPEAVREIRALIGAQAQHRIAKKFGVSQAIISRISRKVIWAHVQ